MIQLDVRSTHQIVSELFEDKHSSHVLEIELAWIWDNSTMNGVRCSPTKGNVSALFLFI